MLNKELIIQVFENHSMKAKVYGDLTNLIPETEYKEMAEEILLLLQPNSEVPPQLQQSDVISSATPEITCTARNCTKPAVGDYNGHGDYACQYHMDKWNNDFDDEYR